MLVLLQFIFLVSQSSDISVGIITQFIFLVSQSSDISVGIIITVYISRITEL